jgi:rare lipoprotein A
MNRVLSSMAATFVMVANMAAAPVPNHQQQQTPSKTPLKTAQSSKPTSPAKASRTGKKPEAKPYQVGVASWYGKQFHGKTTASGEDFDMFEFTAAHRQLPLGTLVKVTNLRNGKSIIVRVNDRGPYVMDRIMDLSYSAARMLNFRDGIERVRLDVVQPQTIAMARGY